MDGAAFTSKPDEAAIRAFLQRLFGRCEREYPGGLIEIRYPTTGKVWDRNWFTADRIGIQNAVSKVMTVNGHGRNVYVGVNPRKPLTPPMGFGGVNDVEIAFFQLIDIDDPVVYAQAKGKIRPHGDPTFYVMTGTVPAKRAHLYWELEEPTRNLAAWTAQQKALIQHFGSDDAIHDPPRIIRVAGTVSYPDKKKAERGYVQEMVVATYFNGNEASSGEFREPVASEALRAVYPPGKVHAEEHSASDMRGNDPSGFNLERGADPMDWVREIRAGRNLHNNSRNLAAHLVAVGSSDWDITTLLEELLRGRSDGGTVNEVPKLIKSAREKWNTPDPGVRETPQPADAKDLAPFALVANTEISEIKTRPWLYGDLLLRGYLTGLIAPGGTGKSMLTIQVALAAAAGIDWAGMKAHEAPANVWIYNNEDDKDELARRTFGAMIGMRIDPKTVAPRFFANSGADCKLMVATTQRDGTVVVTPQVDLVVKHIVDNAIGLLVVDPFVETHSVEENDNVAIAAVAAIYRDIARKANCAVLLVHHSRKPPSGSSNGVAGNADSARGASSLIGVCRVVKTLYTLSDKDAEYYGIDPDKRSSFVRLDDAKANLAPRSDKPAIFELVGTPVGNGTAGGGDQVGVLTPRDFAAQIKKVAKDRRAEDAQKVFDALPEGRYSLRAAAMIVMSSCGFGAQRKTEERMKEVLLPPGAADKFTSGQIYMMPPPDGKDSPFTVVKEAKNG